LPLPSLHIEDDTRGEPRQPVPLRLACLATGLSCADFRYLLAEIQAGGLPYLGACEYRAGDTPRLSPGRPLPEHLAEPAPRAARRCVPGSHPHRPLDAMPRTTLFDGRQVYPRGAYRELLDEALAVAAAGDKAACRAPRPSSARACGIRGWRSPPHPRRQLPAWLRCAVASGAGTGRRVVHATGCRGAAGVYARAIAR